MARRHSPCKECTDKPQDKGCGNHANCDRYKEYRAALNNDNAERRKEDKRESMLNDFYVDGVVKQIKRQGRKI